MEDEKIQYLEAEYEVHGFKTYLKLLITIFREEGYYMVFNQRKARLLAQKFKIPFDSLLEIVDCCLREQLFSDILYKKYSILTSVRIQSNYIKGSVKRTEIILIQDFLLVVPEKEKHPKSELVITIQKSIRTESEPEKPISEPEKITKIISEPEKIIPEPEKIISEPEKNEGIISEPEKPISVSDMPQKRREERRGEEKREGAINGNASISENEILNGHQKAHPHVFFDFDFFMKKTFINQEYYQKVRSRMKSYATFEDYQEEAGKFVNYVMGKDEVEYPKNEKQCIARFEKFMKHKLSAFVAKRI